MCRWVEGGVLQATGEGREVSEITIYTELGSVEWNAKCDKNKLKMIFHVKLNPRDVTLLLENDFVIDVKIDVKIDLEIDVKIVLEIDAERLFSRSIWTVLNQRRVTPSGLETGFIFPVNHTPSLLPPSLAEPRGRESLGP